MNDYAELYDRWHAHVDDKGRAQLEALAKDEEALQDAFYRELSFGTAGLRGVIGMGPNRMNVHTVGKATQGLANYLNAHYENASVAIARDSRLMGEEFVRTAASVLAANGIRALVYPRIEPTPALSFAVRDLGCQAGINVTASHNPSEYNGYKVYGPDGCQIKTQAAVDIQAAIDGLDAFDDVKHMDFGEALAQGLVSWIEEGTLDRFIDAVAAQSVDPLGTVPDGDGGEPLKLVYTPLNGTGLECTGRILERIGIQDVTVVPEQAQPDGTFPTCPYPNPEAAEALGLGLSLCEETGADLLLATDPDADRVGIAVRHGGEYRLLTGNEVGVLLLDYICRMRRERGEDLSRCVAVTTIVSSIMPDAQAHDFGFQLRRVLTGFKYIGEQIALLEDAGEVERFVFGFEESYGYMSGAHVRDKDAINAGMLICQMARWHKRHGRDLVEAMEQLYGAYGYCLNRTVNLSYPGAAGAAKMAALMDGLRENPLSTIAGRGVSAFTDFAPGAALPVVNPGADPAQELPPANVLEFQLEDGCKVLFRPSGTEPKIKAYLFANGSTREEALAQLEELDAAARELLG